MKVLLYSEQLDRIAKSGLGKSIQHQIMALDRVNIDHTTDPEESFDLLHINTYFPKSYFLARSVSQAGKPVVYHAHSTEEDFHDSFRFSNQMAPLFKKWLIECYKQGDVLITPTPYAKRILDQYEINRPIKSISNGIDLTKFKTIPNARDHFLELYNYQEDDYIVMGIGLYLKRKGILDFVELARRMPHIQFIWFGHTDLNLVPTEIRKAIETPLPNLTFAGYVDNEIIRLALQGTDLYIFPTWEETEGIPAVEACASKTDFIVRDIPVFEDWLFDGENVYKAKDIEEFEAKIQLFYDHKLPSLVENAYQVAQERDLTIIGQKLLATYEEAFKLKQQNKKRHPHGEK